MRRVLALSIVFALSGLVTAGALIGLCGHMACCAPSQQDGLTVDRPDCCTTINCADSPVQDLVPASATKHLTKMMHAPVVPASVAIASAPAVVSNFHREFSRPPTLREHLSILSTLLI